MEKLKAVNEWVIVLPVQDETKVIEIVGRKEVPNKGVIVSVGEKVKDVKVKDIVLYKKWDGVEIKWEGQLYIAVKPEHLLAIIT